MKNEDYSENHTKLLNIEIANLGDSIETRLVLWEGLESGSVEFKKEYNRIVMLNSKKNHEHTAINCITSMDDPFRTEAKKRYPRGTLFLSADRVNDEVFSSTGSFYIQAQSVIAYNYDWSTSVYDAKSNKWAEIIKP